MTWYLLSDFTPQGPELAGASPGNVGGGFTDINGNVWSVTAAGFLSQVHNSSSPWNASELIRRTSLDSLVDAQIAIRYTYDSTNPTPYAYLRYRTGHTGYIVGAGYGNFALYSIVNGGLGGLSPSTVSGSGTYTTNLTQGNDYDFVASCVQTNSTTTTFVASIYSVSSAGAAIASGTLMGTWTFTDTTASQQSVAGGQGFFENGGSAASYIKRVQTFTDIAPAAATALVIAGPSTGMVGANTYNVVVTANGALASATTITPTDGAGGTFSPATATLAAGNFPSAAFTYVPATVGTRSVTASGSGLSSNTQSVTVAPANITVPVSSPAFAFSPGNWKGDTGRGGSAYRRTWNDLSYFTFTFTAAATNAAATLQCPSTSSGVAISYFINGVLHDNITVAGNIALTGLVAGAVNVVEVFVRTTPVANSWNNGSGIFEIDGIVIDGNSVAGTSSTRSNWILWVGDSITAGYNVAGDSKVNGLSSHTFFAMRLLMANGYDVCVSACTGSSYIETGNSGNVPAYYMVSGGVYNAAASRWNLIDQGVSLLDGNGQISAYGAANTAPSLIWVNYGTNEWLDAASVSDLQSSIQQCMVALRAAAPAAILMPIIPFGLEATKATYSNAVAAGFAAYAAAHTDAKFLPQDFGLLLAIEVSSGLYTNSDGVHPTLSGHALLAPAAIKAIMGALASATSTGTGIHATGARGGIR